MAFLSPLSLALVTLIFLFLQPTFGTPRESARKIQEESFQKIPKQDIFLRDGSVSSVSVLQRKQRFCLNRLRDALNIVCSDGSGRRALYYSPNQYVNTNQTEILKERIPRTPKSAGKEIPTPSQSRPLLKRRSRRNIVRECCDKPCSFSNLEKYCSVSKVINKSRLHNSDKNLESNHVTPLQDQPSCFGKANCAPVKAIVPQQCVTIEELQRFYLKFLQKQWHQGSKQSASSSTNTDHIEDNHIVASPGKTKTLPKEIPQTDAFVKTNQLIADPHIFMNTLNNLFDLNNLQDVTTESMGELSEDRDANKISEETRSKVESNIMTAPPLPKIIHLPRGTNDYMY